MTRRFVSLALATATATTLGACSRDERPPYSVSVLSVGNDGGTAKSGEVAKAAVDGGASEDASVTASDGGTTPDTVPDFTVSRTSVDFGLVGCGAAGAPVTFTIKNVGPVPFDWSSAMANGDASLFTLTPSEGTIPVSGSQVVTVSMAAVPSTAQTSANFYGDTIALTTKGTSPVQKDVPVKLTAHGAVIRFSVSGVAFGGVPLNQSSAAAFDIVNDGNAPVDLEAVLSNARFQAAPLGPLRIEGAATSARSLTFFANDTAAQTGELSLSSSNPSNKFCAPLPTALSMSGVGTNGVANVTPASLSFGTSGLVDCGTQAGAKTVTVQNTGNAPFDWTAKLSSGAAHYDISPGSGTVQPSTSATFQIIPAPIPQASPVTSDFYAGTVEIATTAVNDSVHIIQLHETARGAVITSTLDGQPLDFGGIKVGMTSALQFSVTNSGNVATDVSFAVGSPRFVVTPGVSLGPSQTSAPSLSFSPSAVQSYDDTLVVTTTAGVPLCSPIPGNSVLQGSGTTSVSVSPTALNFGLVNCGTTANYQTVTISNTGPTMNFVPTLGKDLSSPYTLANDANGAPVVTATPLTLAAGANYTLRIIPAAVVAPTSTAANALGDTLTITTDSPGDAAHNIQLNQTARGAFLSLTPLSSSTTDDKCNHVTFTNFSVINSGNVGIGYSVAAVARPGAPAGTFTINLSSGSLFGGQSQAGILEVLTPPTNVDPATRQYLGDIVLTPGVGLLCSDAQPRVPVAVDTKCAP